MAIPRTRARRGAGRAPGEEQDGAGAAGASRPLTERLVDLTSSALDRPTN